MFVGMKVRFLLASNLSQLRPDWCTGPSGFSAGGGGLTPMERSLLIGGIRRGRGLGCRFQDNGY